MNQLLRECIVTCLQNSEFMREYRRLSGSKVGLTLSPIEQMVDQATRYAAIQAKKDMDEFAEFVEFVVRAVYTPLITA